MVPAADGERRSFRFYYLCCPLVGVPRAEDGREEPPRLDRGADGAVGVAGLVAMLSRSYNIIPASASRTRERRLTTQEAARDDMRQTCADP